MIGIVGLFLVAMMALALWGRLRRTGPPAISRRKCKQCGRYVIGKGPCDCGRGS